MATKVKEQPEEKEVPEIDDETESDSKDEVGGHFTQEDLDEKWQEFMALKKKAGKDQAVILLKEPYAYEDNRVTLTLSNEVLKITFDKLKSDLQGFLRKGLNNKRVILEAIVVEAAREDMIYTNKEKYNHLAKKYPALKDLQEKLGLDPDY